MFRKRLVYELREKEKNHSRQLIMPLELLLPFAPVDAARLHCTPRIPVPCQSVTSLTPYVAKYLCVSAWGGGSGY